MGYQQQVIELFKDYRPEPGLKPYPPYHQGLYLEDYFFKRFCEGDLNTKRIFIPVSWTTCYIEHKDNGLQEKINQLDKNLAYFTISQHDEAVREILPENTWEFNAGGKGGGIPIPLICSQIPAELITVKNRDIFCSFAGAVTHPIRKSMYRELIHNDKYKIFTKKKWSYDISDFEMKTFIDLASRSIFSLCPRGYGKSSFRLYEVMQMGSIPVFIFNQEWFPFNDQLNWDDFCILIHSSDIPNIDKILTDIPVSRIKQMQENVTKIYSENFTLEKVYQKIINKVITA
jgi:hypothetical protein